MNKTVLQEEFLVFFNAHLLPQFDRLDGRIDCLEKRFDRLDEKVDDLALRFDRLEERVKKIEEELLELRAAIGRNTVEMQHVKREVFDIRVRLERLEKQVDKNMHILSHDVVRLYERVDIVESRISALEKLS